MTRRRRSWVVGAATAAIVVAANASQGAYFSQSWGWVALAFLVPATALLILDRVTAVGRLRGAFAVLVGAFAVWVALSSLWSLSTPATLREVERVLVYIAVALAIAFVLRRGDGTAVLAGVALGAWIITAYSLATKLFPDRLDTYDDPLTSSRLAAPLGYWNALGLLAAMGMLAALGFVAHSRSLRTAVAAAAALPILATTLYFTFSRGSWAALAIGLVATVALDPRRLRFVATCVVATLPAIACVALASRRESLTLEDAPAAAVVRDGHRLAAVVAAATVASILAALLVRMLTARVSTTLGVRRAFDVVLATCAAAMVIATIVAVGGPSSGLSKLQDRFNARQVSGGDLNDRLFSVSGSERSEQYRVAWNAALERPVEGYGSGTFEYLWYERRPNLLIVRDGHSLYLETFAELGLVGLSLLGAALLVVLAGGLRGRRLRVGASANAVFVAWMAASAFDWHWETVGVTMTALLAGSVGLLGSERRPRPLLRGGARGALVAVGAALSLAAVWILVGNQALFAGQEAASRNDWHQARDDGRRARALLPWSHEPDLVLGDAAAGLGDRAGAVRAYRRAIDKDSRNWVAWLRLAQVSTGKERVEAYARVHVLNPRESGLPGGR